MSNSELAIRHRPSAIRLALLIITTSALVAAVTACRRAEQVASEAAPPADEEAKAPEILDFPHELHTADQSVNTFVSRAMAVCASGDYDAFRLLWSVRYDPLPRDEFELGWQAVEAIRVRALEQVLLQTGVTQGGNDDQGETAYVVLADVVFDPNHPAGRRESQRRVVLMMTREQDQWRLARAPEPVRAWIKERAQTAETSSDDLDNHP